MEVLESSEHLGFGFAVKLALQSVQTGFVLVVQHDQEFVRAFDLPGVLQAMRAHPEHVKYVGLASVTTANYDQIACSKFRMHLTTTHEFGAPLMPLIFFYDKP